MKYQATILDTEEGSISRKAGICPGDVLVSVNGKTVRDFFDYSYLTCASRIALSVFRNGKRLRFDIRKDENEDLGLVFEHELIDREQICQNRCVFCFIDQLPDSMRKTLYFKDDDARLSFLTGNYVTLTNMGKKDLKRIARLRLSPVNLSVHATGPALRRRILRNSRAGRILDQIAYLAKKGIDMNCQIVLCRGLNDGKHLEKTIRDLFRYHPRVRSLSVVPVGITRYREGLYPLIPFDRESARETAAQILKIQEACRKESGSSFVYPSDELYLMADLPVPSSSFYEGFPQIENGVGLVASLRDEILEWLEGKQPDTGVSFRATVATGLLALPFIREMCSRVMEAYPNVILSVCGIPNQFFGEHVNVSGLLTGRDIIKGLEGIPMQGPLLLTSCLLQKGGDVFLDDMTREELARELGTRVIFVENSGESFIRNMIGGIHG